MLVYKLYSCSLLSAGCGWPPTTAGALGRAHRMVHRPQRRLPHQRARAVALLLADSRCRHCPFEADCGCPVPKWLKMCRIQRPEPGDNKVPCARLDVNHRAAQGARDC
eukprot:scaffold30733_cov129-Isochrysis_galbana.AAC.1